MKKSATNPIDTSYFAELLRAINTSLLAAHNPLLRAYTLLAYRNMIMANAYHMYMDLMKNLAPSLEEQAKEQARRFAILTSNWGPQGILLPRALQEIERQAQ
jgi:hypothetical protein